MTTRIKSGFFPVVHEVKTADHYAAVLGWELSGLMLARLTLSHLALNPLGPAAENEAYLFTHLYRNRTGFAHALCGWPSLVVLELHRISLPDLEYRFHGTVRHYLLLRAQASSRAGAVELALRHFSALQGLINSCFPEAEFSPIGSNEQLAILTKPFEPARATLLTRHQQPLNLAQPLVGNPTGFNAALSTCNGSIPEVQYTYPWVASRDSQERLLRFLLWQTHPVWILVKVRSSAHTVQERARLLTLIQQCDAYLSGTIACRTVHEHQVRLLQEQAFRRLTTLEGGGLQLAVIILTLKQPDSALITLLGDSITEAAGKEHSASLLQGGFDCRSVLLTDALDPWWFPDDQVCTPEEVAAAFRLPSPPHQELPGVPVKRFRSAFAEISQDHAHRSDAIFLGMNVHRGITQPVYCLREDRMRHMFILGMTGVGKSSFLENLVLQDIKNGHGLCLIDPHGELVDKILGKIPADRQEDIILLDPLDTEYPLGFNLLEWKTLEERDRIVDELYRAVDRMYDLQQAGGPIFENNFRNMMRLLMGNKPRDGFIPTIVEFLSIYLHEDFRKWLAHTMDDPLVQDFLKELERTGGECSLNNLSPYITSKLGRFVNDTLLRRMVGQEHTAFDFRRVMDEGKILLMNLGKGRFGTYVGGLLASQIVSRFKNAAMERAAVPEEKRRPFFLYVDEFQNAPQEEFTELLAEARKYRLGLVLANQYTSQLSAQHPGHQGVLQAVLGNVGMFVTFRLGITDAQQLGPIFHPTFSDQDLKELPNWQAYVQLRVDGKVLPPFNVQTVMNETPFDMQKAQSIRNLSRERYGTPAQDVDAQIQSRRKFFSCEP